MLAKMFWSKKTDLPILQLQILKLIRDHVSVPLEAIFNCSISTGTVPDKFKIANVIPVHKQGSHLILNNYCPISLLSVFSGLLERLVFGYKVH